MLNILTIGGEEYVPLACTVHVTTDVKHDPSMAIWANDLFLNVTIVQSEPKWLKNAKNECL